MTDFTYVPDTIDESADFNVDKIQFGDGYSQRVPNGINNGLRRWSVSFSDRSKTEADAIVAFFRARNGATSFTVQPQGFDADVRVVCPSYSRPIQNRFLNGTFVYTVRCTWEETPI
jgi:phage-related protein